MTTLPHSWHRLDDETDRAHVAFLAYLRLPASRRSIARACEEEHGQGSGKSRVAQWERWSARFRWVERARAHDAHLSRVEMVDREEQVRDMNRRHLDLARTLVEVATISASRILERARENGDDDLAARIVLEFAKHGIELDRLAHGLPSTIERTETTSTGEPTVVRVVWGDEAEPEESDEEDWPYDITPIGLASDDAERAETKRAGARNRRERKK